MALREIAEKLFIAIDSETEMRTTYSSSRTSDVRLEDRIATATSNLLTGYEKRADWTSTLNGRYYVLFALEKSRYLRNRTKYFEELNALVTQKLTESELRMAASDWVGSVDILNKAVLRLNEELAGPLEPQFATLLEQKRLEAITALEERLSSVVFQPKRHHEFNASLGSPLEIQAHLHDARTGEPLQSPPMDVNMVSGDLFHYEITHSEYGEALSVYGFVPHDGVAKLYFTVDVPIAPSVKELLSPGIFSKYQSDVVTIEFMPYTVYYDIRETLRGEPDANQPLTKYLNGIGEAIGLRRALQPQAADYTIMVIGTKDIDKRYHMGFESNYSAEVRVYRTLDNALLFKESLPAGEGFARSSAEAGREAFNVAMADVSEFLTHYFTFLCDQQPR